MMQDESVEIQVNADAIKKFVSTGNNSYFEEEGPDDEFRPVSIAIVPKDETRDEGDAEEFRATENDDRATEENGREDLVRESAADDAELRDGFQEVKSIVSDLTSPMADKSLQAPLEPEGEFPTDDYVSGEQSKDDCVALFDGALLEKESEESEDGVENDNVSVVSTSKSVIDESKKHAEEAEALAKEMQRQVAESLAEFSNVDDSSITEEKAETASSKASDPAKDNKELPSSSSVGSSVRSSKKASEFYYSKNKVLKLASSEDEDDMPVVDVKSSSSVASASTTSSPGKNSVHSIRQRPSFRHRRPSTASWTTEEVDSTRFLGTLLENLPITQQQQKILETIVIPSLFVIAAVVVCGTLLHPWIQTGSKSWALTWTLLSIVTVAAPVCALEYMLLSGILNGTILQKKFDEVLLSKYPEVKKFLKDVRRMRLKAGWWYPSEVRTLRKDLEATNAAILLEQQEETMKSKSEDSEDERSLRRLQSREEHYRDKARLEKAFDGERADWYAVKEELMKEAAADKEKKVQLQDQLEMEQQKQNQITAQKVQLENNIIVERAQWQTSRASFEEALKTAVAAQEDNKNTRDFFSKMKEARDEERILWEKERKGLEKTIKQAEDEADRSRLEHEEKLQRLDDTRVQNEAKWDVERRSLKDAVKSAIGEAKEVKDKLEVQICQLMDANDAKYEQITKTLKSEFKIEKTALEQLLEEANGEQRVARQCVQNLHSVLEEERSEWNSSREALEESAHVAKTDSDDLKKKIEQTEIIFEEERATWEAARKTFEDALAAANSLNAEKKAAKNEEQLPIVIKASLQQELKTKESKIKALEESIRQLNKIITIKDTIDKSSSSNKKKKADRAANLTPVAFVVPTDGVSSSLDQNSRSIELSSSNLSAGDNTANSESSSYYAWVQKVQETHNTEQRELLWGLLNQHVRWQKANFHVKQLLELSKAMLDASNLAAECSEETETFLNASASAKRYMDELVTKTGHNDLLKIPSRIRASSVSTDSTSSADETSEETADEKANENSVRSTRSIVVAPNPALRQRLFWSLIAATTSPFRLCNTVVRSVFSGFFKITGMGMGLRRSKN